MMRCPNCGHQMGYSPNWVRDDEWRCQCPCHREPRSLYQLRFSIAAEGGIKAWCEKHGRPTQRGAVSSMLRGVRPLPAWVRSILK